MLVGGARGAPAARIEPTVAPTTAAGGGARPSRMAASVNVALGATVAGPRRLVAGGDCRVRRHRFRQRPSRSSAAWRTCQFLSASARCSAASTGALLADERGEGEHGPPAHRGLVVHGGDNGVDGALVADRSEGGDRSLSDKGVRRRCRPARSAVSGLRRRSGVAAHHTPTRPSPRLARHGPRARRAARDVGMLGGELRCPPPHRRFLVTQCLVEVAARQPTEPLERTERGCSHGRIGARSPGDHRGTVASVPGDGDFRRAGGDGGAPRSRSRRHCLSMFVSTVTMNASLEGGEGRYDPDDHHQARSGDQGPQPAEQAGRAVRLRRRRRHGDR